MFSSGLTYLTINPLILIDNHLLATSSSGLIFLIALSSIFLVLAGSTPQVQAQFGAHEWFVRARLKSIRIIFF